MKGEKATFGQAKRLSTFIRKIYAGGIEHNLLKNRREKGKIKGK